MSCKHCEEAQAGPAEYFYRWRNANILIKGCKEHVREVIFALREATSRQEPKP